MAHIIDMHIHTTFGSYDSVINAKHLQEKCISLGLDGVAITEHVTAWSDERVESFRQESGLFAYSTREFATDDGHFLVLGVNHVKGMRSLQDLRQAVLDAGGLMILAHPFRYFPGRMSLLFGNIPYAGSLAPEQLAEHPIFSLVDEIEVLNHGCTEKENRLALEVARVLGKRGTGGSDAHTQSEIGRCVTVFERPLNTNEDLLRELRAGRFHAAKRVNDGQFVPFYEP